jgi:hypothetical protein
MIKHYKRSYFSEVQSRALEYLQFNKSNKDKMKEKMVEAVPVPQSKKENWEREQKEKRKLVDDKDEDNYEPEDDLICVRLTEGVIKNIQINEMEIKENNNTGLDFLGEKEDENDNNINNNKQTGNLDLLDLNNIFSAASGNNPADINSNNNNQNNNQGGNPFDILNMQLNQNNQNNNQQSNNDINNILNMVIGNNNNTNNNNIPDNNIENKKPTTEINIMKECFKNDDITMYYNI